MTDTATLVAVRLRLLQKWFFNRTDAVAISRPSGKPCPVEPVSPLDEVLLAHLLGTAGPRARVRAKSEMADVLAGPFRVGSYGPALDQTTRWICIDFDGVGRHSTPLQDARAAVLQAYRAAADAGLVAYLESSGSGTGWHLWIFFSAPLPASAARKIGFALAPRDAPLADGTGFAVPEKNAGIEVFPKQDTISVEGYGNLVWLPWWSEAPVGANTFYSVLEDGSIEEDQPTDFAPTDPSAVDHLLAQVAGAENVKRDVRTSSSVWRDWRQTALAVLPLEAVYADLLTGRRRSKSWLEARDPASPTGDRTPSASIADGTGLAERGFFYSFRTCQARSVFDFLIEQRGSTDFRAACAEVARLTGVPLPTAAESKAANGDTARFPLTDTGNAERLVAHYGSTVRYCHTWESWLVWDGKRWKRDATAELMRMAKRTARSITEEFKAYSSALEAGGAEEDDYCDALQDFGRKSESAEKRRAMVAMAANEAAVSTEAVELDASPWLLNVQNGILDLRTGTLTAHEPATLLTRLVPIAYDRDAGCQRWEQFLREIFLGKDDLISFIQRAVGYSLTGITREQKFFLCHGTGENGKSIFLKVLAMLLGEYALASDFDTFASAEATPGAPRPDLVRLRGARLVTAAEPDQRVHLSESRLKLITGEDTVVARNLHEQEQEFRPILKLWLMANHRPTVTESNHGFWRRVQLIPFDYRVPAEQKDPLLGDKLQAELGGILAWAVRGCLAWREAGLGVAQAVAEATDAYRSEMDVVGRFVEDECLLAPEASVTKPALYAAYQRWCTEGDEKPISTKSFTLKLKERGLKDSRSKKVRSWTAIGLRAAEEGDR